MQGIKSPLPKECASWEVWVGWDRIGSHRVFVGSRTLRC